MKIVERQVGDVVILDLHGKILIGEGDDALREAVTKLADSGKTKILLNLADVPYVDSAGLGEIVRTYTTVSRKGGKLKLLNLTKKIQDLLSITKLLTVFETLRFRGRGRPQLRLTAISWRAGPMRPARAPGDTPGHGPMTLPRALLVSLRPHQWIKNLVVLAALAFSKHLFEPDAFLRAAVAFVVFCALAGAAYLVNDLLDVEQDRQHPLKRQRPIASGALPARAARLAAAVLTASALAASAWLGRDFALVALGYFLLTLAYSLVLKHHVILDVLAIAIGFVLRAVAGALAIGVRFSDWLLVCTILLALFLALAKRRHELVSLEDASGHRRILREYSPYLLDQMIAVVTASCLTAYAFYTLAPETVEKYQTDRLSWTIPFVIYGIFRYLYLVHRKEKGGSPTEVLLADRPLLAAVALWAVVVIAIVYTAPGVPVPRGR